MVSDTSAIYFSQQNQLIFISQYCQRSSTFECCEHCAKIVRIRSDSGPYSVRMRENTDHNNSENGHFSRSEAKMAIDLNLKQSIRFQQTEYKNILLKRKIYWNL